MYNGMPFQREQLDPDELETVTMHKILETTTFYQRAVYLVSNNTLLNGYYYAFDVISSTFSYLYVYKECSLFEHTHKKKFN